MHGYLGALAVAAVALAAVGVGQLLHRASAVAPGVLVQQPAPSGWAPQQHALSRVHVRWYPLALVFLAFDVEMLFMYPWTLVVASVGTGAVVEMFAFFGVLLVGVAWAWREGALRWV